MKNKKYYIFIILSLLALTAFFIITNLIKYNLRPSDENLQSQSTPSDPLVTSASQVYQAFVRDDNPTWGQGQLAIITFCDFTTDKCKQVWQNLQQLRQDTAIKNKITLVWKNFPLATNPLAMPAAQAAFCSKEQNKFWEFGDLLFNAQNNFNEVDFLKFAKDLKLNTNKFEACFNLPSNIELIGQDMEDAGKLLINGIPYVFVGSRRVNIDDVDQILEIIKQEVK